MASIQKDSSRNCDIKYVHGMSIYVTDNRGMKTAELYALKYDDNSRLFTIEIEDNTRKTIIFNKYNIKNLGSWLVRPSIELFLQNEKEDKKQCTLQFFWPNDMEDFIHNLDCYTKKIQNELDIELHHDKGLQDRLAQFANLPSEGSVDITRAPTGNSLSRMDSFPDTEGGKRRKKRKRTKKRRKSKHKTRNKK